MSGATLVRRLAAGVGTDAGTSARRMGATGIVLLATLTVLAIGAPLFAGHDPTAATGPPFHAPTASYPLGTDDVGHDLFAQLLYGARVSLAIGTLSALLAVGIGLAVALTAGWFRGRVEIVLMRMVDLVLALPFLVLAILFAAFFGRGLLTTVLVIGAVIWARPSRVLRAQVLKVRELQHVEAAHAMGASPARIITRHIFPRIAPLAVSQFVRAANVAVLVEASLAFLGLGDPGQVSWGTTLYYANQRSAFLTDAWTWWMLPPGLALTAAIVGFALVGFAIEEWADPRLSRGVSRRGQRRPTAAQSSAPQDADTVLEVRDLAVEYRGRTTTRAVDGVSFVVAPGRIVGLVGESGSGKSTIATALLRLVDAPGAVTAGSVFVGGRDLYSLSRADMTRARGRDIALVPQSAMNALNPAYTIRNQLIEAAALLPRDAQASSSRADELLELVGIPCARGAAYPHELSGGMRQRVVIAMALANEPQVLVADEPVTGLDVVTQERIMGLLDEIRRRFGLGILLISHDLPLVARVADDIVVMQAGRIVEQGPTGVLARQPRHSHTQALLAPLVRAPASARAR